MEVALPSNCITTPNQQKPSFFARSEEHCWSRLEIFVTPPFYAPCAGCVAPLSSTSSNIIVFLTGGSNSDGASAKTCWRREFSIERAEGGCNIATGNRLGGCKVQPKTAEVAAFLSG